MSELVTLDQLVDLSGTSAPNWMGVKGCIYKITNLINGKIYIGQTSKSLFDRLKGHIKASRKSSSSILYKAMRKHGLENFSVELVLGNCPNEFLDYWESYYIAHYESYAYLRISGVRVNKGYNMTPGGGSCHNLHTEEIRSKIYRSIARSYDGDIAGQLHTKESREKAIRNAHTKEAEYKRQSTNKSNHGGVLPLNTGPSMIKSKLTRSIKGNGDCMYGCHTSTAISKMMSTKIIRYGSVTASMSTPEAIEIRSLSSSVTKLLKSISTNISRLKDSGKELTYENYSSGSWSLSHKGIHLKRIKDKISSLRNDERWTEEMDELFKDI